VSLWELLTDLPVPPDYGKGRGLEQICQGTIDP
jgi:hypothetical protein